MAVEEPGMKGLVFLMILLRMWLQQIDDLKVPRQL